MKIAVVGVKRDYQQLPPNYVRMFNKYHLEIPFYYAELGGNDVTVTTTNYTTGWEEFPSGGRFRNEAEQSFLGGHDLHRYDIIIHWRKWFPEFYHKDAVNLLHTCDHTYPTEWKQTVREAFRQKQLRAVICYRGWHADNMVRELTTEGFSRFDVKNMRIETELTFGVDPLIYAPSPAKDPYSMLWSSDPGRGLQGAVELAVKLYARDRRFKLHVCHPDYTKMQPIVHPAIVWRGNVNNGPDLWKLFNETGILPYTSTFKEPSSRAARQGQAAGSLVLYPPNMGTPSEYVRDMETGIMRPVSQWIDKIVELTGTPEAARIQKNAVDQALSESWAVQAKRFNERFKGEQA